MILTPTQMRNIYHNNGGTGQYSTWTQISSVEEWAPGELAVYMFWQGTVIVGASAKDKGALDTWRRKYSLRRIPGAHVDSGNWERSKKYDEWKELNAQGYKQSEIARMLDVSPAYCSIIKKRLSKELQNF